MSLLGSTTTKHEQFGSMARALGTRGRDAAAAPGIEGGCAS